MKGNHLSFPSPSQLPASETIPNPFVFFDIANDPNGDGVVTDSSEWEARKAEIRQLVQYYWLGYRWPTSPSDVAGQSYRSEEPYTVRVGFHFPPYAYGVEVNVREEFERLASRLMRERVDIRRIIPPSHFFGSPEIGDVVESFGPAPSADAAEELAIAAWNAGYFIPYEQNGTKYAVLRDYTGLLEAPPEREKMRHVVTVRNPGNGRQAGFAIDIRMPTGAQIMKAWNRAEKQVPAIIDIGGTLSGALMNTLNEHGYACIKFTATDIYPDNYRTADGIRRDGVYTTLYPYDDDVYEFASGALMAWSWGASQIVSALEQPAQGRTESWGAMLGIDPSRIAVTGHSRYGKAAIFAAAFDERFKIVIASEPGGSGIQSFRYTTEGKIFRYHPYPKADRVHGRTEIPTDSYGGGTSWFPDKAAAFVNRDDHFPFDACHIISLIAPRPFLATGGLDTHWLGSEGSVASIQAAAEVYAFVGRDEIEKSNIAVRFRESNHALYNRDLAFVIALMDREFKQSGDKRLHVQDLFPEGDGSLNSMTYPAKTYDRLSDWNSYPFDINSSYMPWSRPGRYVLWTATETFLCGSPVEIAAHSDAPQVMLLLPDGSQIEPARREGETFIFRLTREQALRGRYELRTAGAEKENRSVYLSAISLADALRHAPAKGDGGGDTRLIGFGSRLVRDPSNPVEVYIGGERAEVSMTRAHQVSEDARLLDYGILFRDALFAKIAERGWDASKTFHIRNLKFETIPGFTFEISWGNIYASAEKGGLEGAERFTQPISWPVEAYDNGPAGSEWPVIPDTKAEKDILKAGGTVARPAAPGPKPSAFAAKIEAAAERAADTGKIHVTIRFDQPLDIREFGFGLDIAGSWETAWSSDGRRVTLIAEPDPRHEVSSGSLIIFRLKDEAGNMLPRPVVIPLRLS